MEPHANRTEDVGQFKAVFFNGALQNKGDNRYHRAGCGNAPHEHGA